MSFIIACFLNHSYEKFGGNRDHEFAIAVTIGVAMIAYEALLVFLTALYSESERVSWLQRLLVGRSNRVLNAVGGAAVLLTVLNGSLVAFGVTGWEVFMCSNAAIVFVILEVDAVPVSESRLILACYYYSHSHTLWF